MRLIVWYLTLTMHNKKGLSLGESPFVFLNSLNGQGLGGA